MGARFLSTDLKGYTITFRYNDGYMQEVPILSYSYMGALEGACVKIETDKDFKHNLADVDEIRIVDPSIGEIFKKIGAGAKKVAHEVKEKGTKFLAGVKKGLVKGAEVAGQVRVLPSAMKEAYVYGKERGAFVPPEERVEPTPAPTPIYTTVEPVQVQPQIPITPITVTRATPEEPARWDRKELMRLADQTRSGDATVKAVATGYLRRFYPEVYEELRSPSIQPSG